MTLRVRMRVALVSEVTSSEKEPSHYTQQPLKRPSQFLVCLHRKQRAAAAILPLFRSLGFFSVGLPWGKGTFRGSLAKPGDRGGDEATVCKLRSFLTSFLPSFEF